MGTFTSSEYPDEMQQIAAFCQGVHCKGKKDLQTKEYNINTVFLKIRT